MSDENNNDKFKAILNGSLDSMYYLLPVLDADGEVSDFRCADVNAAGAELLGLDQEKIIGSCISNHLTSERADSLLQRLAAARKSGQAVESEEEMVLGPRSVFVREQIIPLPEGILVQVRDITGSRRAQQDLRDSQEYLASVIANIPVILYELDRDGVFKLSTGRSLSQIGLAPGEAVGKSMTDYFPDGSPEVAAFQRALTGESFTTQTTLGDGYFDSRYTPRYDDAGNIVGVLGISYDITEQRLAEEQLRRAQRLDAVGQLTGGIAHDFNNLLAVILGNLDLLEKLAKEDDDAARFIQRAIAATERGATLTRRLLAFSRKQLLEPSITDTNDLVAGMLAMLSRTLPENIVIAFEPADDLWQIHIDAPQLEHAVLNLCLNARDAMPEGGKLSIQTRNISLAGEEAQRINIEPRDYVELLVKDTGCGIPEDLREVIFEPFYTTKEVGKGNGLGLSMVYGFIDQSGGAIDLSSETGAGTGIRLLLPTSEAKSLARTPTSDSRRFIANGTGERILVVEDDSDVRQFVSDALSALNYEVVQARNGDLALQWLDRGEPLDLMFSDIVLPGELSGIELTRHALTLRPGLNVLLTTGYAKDASAGDLETLSHLEVLPKPYRTADLARKLRTLLDPPS
ncbi:MAG: PAS domain-containing protein [Halieaceae bacterium]